MKITKEQQVEIQAHLNMWKTLIEDFEKKQKGMDPDSLKSRALDQLCTMYLKKVEGALTILNILGYDIDDEDWKLKEEEPC